MEAAMLTYGESLTIGKDALAAEYFAPVMAACSGIRTLVMEVSYDDGFGAPLAWVTTGLAIDALEIGDYALVRCEATL
jgi:hypothetical protein